MAGKITYCLFSISLSKIDNNYDKHLEFFQKWEIKEVKACWVYFFVYYKLFAFYVLRPDGFSKAPETFRARKAAVKSRLNLAITELFYSHIFKMKRGSLHTRRFRRIHFSIFRYRWTKNGFTGPKSFRGFRELNELQVLKTFQCEKKN